MRKLLSNVTPQLLPIKTVKGQLLNVCWPKELPLPNFLLNAHFYLIPDAKKHTCTIGATFEKQFKTEGVDIDTACKELFPKLNEIFGSNCQPEVLNCVAGLRATTPDHKPLTAKINEKTWVITGMGSKGLLYHGLTAKKLVNSVMETLT